jgi:cellulose synthase/poly-beta-1,6-N-acetylglucosamine synthase-like glycosyltransferase
MYWLPAILILPYFFLLLKIYRNLLKIIPFSPSSVPSTYVSVIIACRNEQEKLPLLLEHILGQDYPEELFEVIIVDDNSTDNTFETASENSRSDRFFVLKNRGEGKKESIRTGIIASRGRLIVTTDADCTMGKSWLKTIAAFFEKTNPDMIICPVQLAEHRGLFKRFQELEYMSLQGITAGSAMAGNGIMCNGANLAFTREAYLNQMDNLKPELATGDDVFMLHSLKKEIKSRIMWLESTDSVVSTAPSPSVSSFLSQRKRWISKWNAYNDRFTILTGIVTFVATLVQLYAFIFVFFKISFIWPFLSILILKSVADFLILQNTTARYGKPHLMCWFLPAQLIYPFYVIAVVLYSLIPAPGKAD